MYPRPHVTTQIWIFALGCIFGITVGIEFFTDGMGESWATFAGAAGGAVITVLGTMSGMAWLEARKQKCADAGISLRMAPGMIVMRGNLRNGNTLLRRGKETGTMYDDEVLEKIKAAYSAWQSIQPMLDHFPDTAIDSYRLERTFRELLDDHGPVPIWEPTFLNALLLATNLASRFKVDEVDLE